MENNENNRNLRKFNPDKNKDLVRDNKDSLHDEPLPAIPNMDNPDGENADIKPTIEAEPLASFDESTNLSHEAIDNEANRVEIENVDDVELNTLTIEEENSLVENNDGQNKLNDFDDDTANLTPDIKRRRDIRAKKKRSKKIALIVILGIVVIAAGVLFAILFKIPAAASVLVTHEESNEEICAPFSSAGLDCTVKWQSNSETLRGNLISQTPAPGSLAMIGSKVELVYSQGPAESEMPDVSKMTLDEAKDSLYAIGITVSSIEEKDGTEIEQGRVVEASVEPGAVVENGDEVSLIVSSGKVNTPELIGKTRGAIETELGHLGVTVNFVEESSDKPAGSAIAQTPKAGEKIPDEGITVVIAKSAENASVTIPDVVGKSAEEAQKALADAGFRNITTVLVKNSQVTETQVTQVVPNSGETADKQDNIVLIVSEPNS